MRITTIRTRRAIGKIKIKNDSMLAVGTLTWGASRRKQGVERVERVHRRGIPLGWATRALACLGECVPRPALARFKRLDGVSTAFRMPASITLPLTMLKRHSMIRALTD